MDDRYLNFNSFIKQRALEIARFTEILQVETAKRGHQALPKSVRRRAMSHNRYRIPLKLRRPLQQDLVKAESMQRVPKCRKSIRKRQRLIVSYRARSGKVRWLNTHIWAAKRMRMGNYSGFKVAESPNNKSFRSAYRHFRHNCCMVDLSYFHCLTIRSESADFSHFLPHQLSIKAQTRHCNQLYQGQLRNGHSLVCPILLFLQSEHVIRCIFDPYCLDEVKTIQFDAGYSVEIGKTKSEIYVLLGPQAVARVTEAFRCFGIPCEVEENQMKLNASTGRIYYLDNSQKVRSMAKPLGTKPCPQTVALGYNPEQNTKLRQAFFASIKPKKLPKQSESKAASAFWQFYDRLQLETQEQGEKNKEYFLQITNRSKYTHKRKNKMTREEKKAMMEAESKAKNTEKSQQIGVQILVKAQQKSKEEKEQPKVEAKVEQTEEKLEELDPIMLAPFSDLDSQLFQGCFIFCSNKHNCKLWQALSKQNVKVIGRKELKNCYFQAGIRFFPDDYNEASCFTRYNKERAIGLIDRHRRLPPQKRANYCKINSPYPFYFHLPSQTQTRQVKISMISRGRCFPGSYICRLSPEDYNSIADSIQKQGIAKSIVSEPIQKETQPSIDYTQSYEQITGGLAARSSAMMRSVIGFITSGGFKFSESKEGGLGFLFGVPRLGEQFEDEQYVLIRKPTSRHYFVAMARLI